MVHKQKIIEVKFVVHDSCDKEVLGVIISTIKHNTGLECTVGDFDSFSNGGIDELDGHPQVIVVLVGNTFDDVYHMVINNVIIRSPEIILRLGIAIGGVEKPLSELTAFKIVSLTSVDTISKQIKEVVNASSEEE